MYFKYRLWHCGWIIPEFRSGIPQPTLRLQLITGNRLFTRVLQGTRDESLFNQNALLKLNPPLVYMLCE
jgi:hypothetical protein